jgi:hypothetical protein
MRWQHRTHTRIFSRPPDLSLLDDPVVFGEESSQGRRRTPPANELFDKLGWWNEIVEDLE